MNERLAKMRELGQAPWVDELSREDIEGGGLRRMIDDGIVGVTSNPAIFQKAIAGSDLYDEQLHELAQREDDPKQIFWEVARKDIQDACDIFRPVHEETGGTGWLYLTRGPARHRLRYRGHGRGGHQVARDGRQAQPLRQDTGHVARARCDRGDDLARQVHKRHPDLLPGALP